MTQRILIVDDESAIREMTQMALELAGFEALQAADGSQALIKLERESPDLVILDWMMPGANGLEVARKIRKASDVPILILTAKEDEDAKINGLSVADDFVTKPFSPRELVARIHAILRRTQTPKTLDIAGQIRIDAQAQRAYIQDTEITLSPLEFRLLQYFMGHPERAFSREQLLDQVWGADAYVEDRTVDVHIRRLRKALGEHGQMIETVRGTGYRFRPD